MSCESLYIYTLTCFFRTAGLATWTHSFQQRNMNKVRLAGVYPDMFYKLDIIYYVPYNSLCPPKAVPTVQPFLIFVWIENAAIARSHSLQKCFFLDSKGFFWFLRASYGFLLGDIAKDDRPCFQKKKHVNTTLDIEGIHNQS